jgi:hypothetical protein
MKTGSRALLIFLLLAGFFPAAMAPGQSNGAQEGVKSGNFHCSPAPCVLPPTQASEGGGTVTDSLIVTNPLNQKELLLGSFDGNCDPSALGFHLSRDGGSTWNRVLCMPFIHTKNFVYEPSFEPSVGYDRNGIAYVAGFYNDNEGGNHGFVAVQRSSDGTHWSKPVVALGQPGDTQPLWTSLAVDSNPTSPWLNSLYVSGMMRTDLGHRNQVLVSHSWDGGTTWSQAAVDPVQEYPEEDNFTRMTIGKHGTIYTTWMHCRGKSGSGGGLCPTVHMMFSKSGDGGNVWAPPLLMATVKMPHFWQLPNTKGERVFNYPVIAVDNSDGPYAGNLYVAMYTWTGTYLRVQVIRSSDGGKTWSKPVPVAPASDTHDQFFPALSVSPKGLVGVSWLDRRNDPANHNYQAFAAVSTDGGRTFPNTQLTQAFSDPDTNGTGNNWMGDYTGNTWAGGDFIAAWMDSSNGIDMQEVVGGIRLH